ncbi:MAG: glycine--tRNA ligase [Candidatus Hadarchaeales archaeon]
MQIEEDVLELAKRRGFIWPAFEIYGGAAGFYDYGPLGVALKNRIIEKWRSIYVGEENFLEIDSPTVTPEEVLKASGHVDHFVDVMVECTKCGNAFKLTEVVMEAIQKDVEGMPKEEIQKIVESAGIKCPTCRGDLSRISDFNAMFKTAIGPGSKKVGYLRPETAQGIFINFRRLFRLARGKLPFGVVQIGRGYRNEISPRQGMIRLREFTMAEAEVFFDPEEPRHPKFSKVKGERLRLWPAKAQIAGSSETLEATAGEAVENKIVCNELMAYYLVLTKRFLEAIGIPSDAIRFREQTPGQRAHYSRETWDAEVFTKKFGWVEIAGIAYRTDYDLSRHSEFSGVELTAYLEEKKKKIICHVVEPSYGIDRPFYCLLEHAYTVDGKRRYLRLKKDMAPVEVAVLPLLTKDGLPEKASEVFELLKKEGLRAEYDEAGSIGRRYMRADEIGTPFCVTVDHRTLQDQTVTIRDRDSTKQVRVAISSLSQILVKLLRDEISFEEAGTPVE